MIKHTVIEILKKLSKDEIRSLRKLVETSFFNKSRKLRQLFNEIIKHYPSFDNQNFTKEKVFKKISKTRAFNDSTYRGLMHDILKLIYMFLLFEDVEGNLLDNKVRLIGTLLKKDCYTAAKAELNNKKLKQRNRTDYGFHLNNYLLESYRYNIESETSHIHNKKQASNLLNTLSNSDFHLLLFFITELASEYIGSVILAFKYNLENKNSITSQVLSVLDLKKLLLSLNQYTEYFYVLDLYGSLLEAFDKINNKSYYSIYKRKVFKYENKLSQGELAFHITNLINYLNMKKNQTQNVIYSKELFEVYEYFLAKELFIDSRINYLKPGLFRAIVLNALECKKYEWTENFINIYGKKVPLNDRLVMQNYGYALFYNATGDNSKSLECIEKIKINNFIFKYDTYNTKLKIYYEYQDPQKALDYIRTYQEFLRKDRFFSESRKLSYKNFIKFIKELIKCREDHRGSDIGYTMLELEKLNSIINREWVMSKVEELKKTKETYKYVK